MQCTLVSDSHLQHEDLELPGGDLLIHAGDWTVWGREDEVTYFFSWARREVLKKYQYIVCIAGNHELAFEFRPHTARTWIEPYLSDRFFYLQDSSVELNGYKIYGSPWTPRYGYGFAFNEDRGKLFKHWNQIPSDADIVVTHGPAHGYGDGIEYLEEVDNPLAPGGLHENVWIERVGCAELLSRLAHVKPLLHVSGHIHEGYGVYRGRDALTETTFVNAAVMGREFIRKPIEITLPVPRAKNEG